MEGMPSEAIAVLQDLARVAPDNPYPHERMAPLYHSLGLEKESTAELALARKLKRRQDYVSDIETGQKVVTVVELMEWSAALGFDPQAAIRMLKTIE